MAAPDTTEVVRIKRNRPLRVAVDVGATFGLHASEFFRDYKFYLRGPSSTFNAPETMRLSVSSYQLEHVSFGISASYYRAVVRETYDFRPGVFDTVLGLPPQTLSQALTMSVIPTILTIDYYPIDRQFTTYVGVGAGVAFSTLAWNEGTSASQSPGARRSGERYNATHVSPALMLRTGVSLGLDKLLARSTSASVHIEASYAWIPIAAPLFKTVANNLPTADQSLREDYVIQAGGLGIHLGLSFFLR